MVLGVWGAGLRDGLQCPNVILRQSRPPGGTQGKWVLVQEYATSEAGAQADVSPCPGPQGSQGHLGGEVPRLPWPCSLDRPKYPSLLPGLAAFSSFLPSRVPSLLASLAASLLP